MDATLQYPLYHYAIETFAKQSSMKLLTNALDRSRDQFGAQNLPYLGVFAENHVRYDVDVDCKLVCSLIAHMHIMPLCRVRKFSSMHKCCVIGVG